MSTPSASINVFAILSSWQCLEVQGPDALDFFQRLSSADFKRLKPGQFTPAMLLQATGKISLYFKAICLENNNYLILTPSPGKEAHDALEKMHFRENFAIKDLGDQWTYLRLLGENTPILKTRDMPTAFASSKGAVQSRPEIIFLNESQWNKAPIHEDWGALVKGPHALAQFKTELIAAGFLERASLEGYRIRAGSPAAPNELGPTIIALEAGSEDAIHENKGCYPGQEVIERIRSMGQVPRYLSIFRGPLPAPLSNSEVLLEKESTKAGTLTSVDIDPIDPHHWVGLGFLKRLFAKPEQRFSIAGQMVEHEIVNIHQGQTS